MNTKQMFQEISRAVTGSNDDSKSIDSDAVTMPCGSPYQSLSRSPVTPRAFPGVTGAGSGGVVRSTYSPMPFLRPEPGKMPPQGTVVTSQPGIASPQLSPNLQRMQRDQLGGSVKLAHA